MSVLVALVEGHRAREGLKDRLRALSEWEIARRSGITDLSYAEFFEHPSREPLVNALSTLQRLGLVSVWERGVKYDTFVPTPKGDRMLASESEEPVVESQDETGGGAAEALSEPVIARLDEIIRLLRSLDAKLPARD